MISISYGDNSKFRLREIATVFWVRLTVPGIQYGILNTDRIRNSEQNSVPESTVGHFSVGNRHFFYFDLELGTE